VNKELSFTNVSKGTATMLIYKEIGGGENGVDGARFAEEMQMINEYYSDEVKCINIRINSPGGSVQDGLSICSAILNSEIPCDTYIDGMAYSMAGVIAMCGRNRYMVDYGTFMMHNAQGGSDEDVLDLITNSLAKIFERNTNLTMDKCKSLMAAETWMDATQCMVMGLVDSIINTNNQKPEVSNNSIKELYNFYNKLITKKMTNLTNLLKLSNDASETSIIEAVTAKDAAIDTLKQAIEAKDAEKVELENKLKELQNTIAERENAEKVEVIENAVKSGLIDAATKDIYVNSNKTIVELKEVFGKLKPAYTPVFDNKATTSTAPAGREKWTFNDWSKQDPKGLSEMQKNDPTTFANLLAVLPKELSNNYNPETDKRF
jgi:ATP-dependent protease ClpP protease subunit/predicted DNA-binding protein YlxM (UPF0122 family)